MGFSRVKWWLVLVFWLSIFGTFTASSFISEGVFGSKVVSERRLLQIKQKCPVSFETLNYTNLTSQCKAPNYPPQPCCSAFREIVCPFRDELNDMTNDCADTMFSYIILKGYPQGLFANKCIDNKDGSMSCPVSSPDDLPTGKDGASAAATPTACVKLMIVLSAFGVVFT